MKKKTKQTSLNAWATSTTNSSAGSSGSYTYTPKSVTYSSSVWNGTLNIEKEPLTEDRKINITLLDGTEVTMILKDYFQFVAYNLMVPSDCKNLDEFNEKMLVFRI